MHSRWKSDDATGSCIPLGTFSLHRLIESEDHPTEVFTRILTHNERLDQHKQPCGQGDDDDDPIIHVDFRHTMDELIEKCEKGKFDGKDGGPGEIEKSIQNGKFGVAQLVELIDAGLGQKGWIGL